MLVVCARLTKHTREVGVWIDHGTGPFGFSVPCAMDIVRHEVEEVNILSHALEIKALQIPFMTCQYCNRANFEG